MDPFAALEVALEANDEEIRAAYLRKVKEFPPDRDPEKFERVRDAYDTLRDHRQRARYRLFGIDPRAPLPTLLRGRVPEHRKFVGPDLWLATIKEEQKHGK